MIKRPRTPSTKLRVAEGAAPAPDSAGGSFATDSTVLRDYARVATAIQFLDTHFREQPALQDVAAAAGLSVFHFQRLFRRWAGISPKRFLQYLTAEYARSVLTRSQDVFDATYDAGLSGPGRLHDLFVNIYAATPAQVRGAGAGLTIQYGFAASPFGECLVGQTERGLCGLAFADRGDRDGAEAELRGRWPAASFVRDDAAAKEVVGRVFATSAVANEGVGDRATEEANNRANDRPLTLLLKGTNFQIRVWEALLRIPAGQAVTYQTVAEAIGMPGGARAVGSAIGCNPLAYVIPCHRVLRKSGALGGYRWGDDRKRALLGWEAARTYGEMDDQE